MDQRAKAEALRALHVPGRPLLLVNAWDAGERRRDRPGRCARRSRPRARVPRTRSATPTGSGSRASRCSSMVATIAAAVDLPVTADMEAGYGDAPEDAAATARGVLEAGAVGLNLEDHARRRRRAAPDRALRRPRSPPSARSQRRPGCRSSSTRAPTSSSARSAIRPPGSTARSSAARRISTPGPTASSCPAVADPDRDRRPRRGDRRAGQRPRRPRLAAARRARGSRGRADQRRLGPVSRCPRARPQDRGGGLRSRARSTR